MWKTDLVSTSNACSIEPWEEQAYKDAVDAYVDKQLTWSSWAPRVNTINTYFDRYFYMDEWLEYNHVKDGWDWSVPLYAKPHPKGAIKVNSVLAEDVFPGNTMRMVTYPWRLIEQTEGVFDFSDLIAEIQAAANNGEHQVQLRIFAAIKTVDPTAHTEAWVALHESAPYWLADKGIDSKQTSGEDSWI